MEYRKADSMEHEIICNQIRRKSVLYVCLMAPVGLLTILAMFLSIRMMIRQKYDASAFVISVVFMAVLAVAVAILMIASMRSHIVRISCINNRKYLVADCIISGKDQQINPKHIHSFITVGFPDDNNVRVEVPPEVYSLAEYGKKALLVKFDEPEGRKKKLPYEAAVL